MQISSEKNCKISKYMKPSLLNLNCCRQVVIVKSKVQRQANIVLKVSFKTLFAFWFPTLHRSTNQLHIIAKLRIKGQGNKFNHSIKINLKVTYVKVIDAGEGELVEILIYSTYHTLYAVIHIQKCFLPIYTWVT